MRIELTMSATRLFEALRDEARRTGDRELIRRWNERQDVVRERLARRDAERAQGLNPYAALWGG